MKKIYNICFLLFLVLSTDAVIAQAIGDLKGIHFQAVAIDENGQEVIGMDINGKPVYNKTIGVRFSILSGNDGPVLYQETHSALTDQNGLFSLIIGGGTVSSEGMYSTLMEIPWIEANQFLKVEISIKNDGNYKLVSLQQFMSVPYSFYTDDIADNAITTAKILNGTILNEDVANGTIDLTSKVNGVLPVANGGTGASTLTNTGVLVGGGTSAVRALPAASDGQIPIGVAGADPVMATLTAGTGINITNEAGKITIESGVTGVNGSDAGTVVVGILADGEGFTSAAIPVPGVAFGDIIVASFNKEMNGVILSAYVSSPNNVKVRFQNETGASVNLGTGALKVLVVK